MLHVQLAHDATLNYGEWWRAFRRLATEHRSATHRRDNRGERRYYAWHSTSGLLSNSDTTATFHMGGLYLELVHTPRDQQL